MKNEQLFNAWDRISPSPESKERMLHNIRCQAAASPARPRLVPRRALALALILVVMLGATAFALSESGLVNWFGKKVTDNMPHLAVSEMDLETIQSRAQKAKAIIEQTPEGEVWVADIWEKTQILSSLSISYTDPADLAARVQASGKGMMVPTNFPEGYAFKSGSIGYYLSEEVKDSGILPLGEETVEEGILLKKFRITGNYDKDIEVVDLTHADAQGNQLRFTAYLDRGDSQYAFNTSSAGTHEPVTVRGMTDALYINNPDDPYHLVHNLHFRKTGLPKIAAYSWHALQLPKASDDTVMTEKPYYYDSVVYHIRSNTLGKDALIEIADSLE